MKFTYIGDQGNKEIRIVGTTANSSFQKANSAAISAQAAFNQANAAYAYANTGGAGGTTINNYLGFPFLDLGYINEPIENRTVDCGTLA